MVGVPRGWCPAVNCWSCPRKPPNLAAYMWTASPSGNEIPLCAECCAAWRVNAVAEPDLGPARIRSLLGAS